MATVRTWEGVAVDVQSALASAVTINSITKANPAVVGYTGTDPVTGDFVLMDVLGMSEVDESVYRIAAVDVTANTFQLEGVDSTLYKTFTSGTFQVATLGVSMTIGRSITASGGDPSFIDISTIHDLEGRQTPGRLSPISYAFECYWDPADASLKAFMAAATTRTKRVIRMTWPDGAFILFTGHVAASGAPTGTAGDAVVTPVTFTIGGRISSYTA